MIFKILLLAIYNCNLEISIFKEPSILAVTPQLVPFKIIWGNKGNSLVLLCECAGYLGNDSVHISQALQRENGKRERREEWGQLLLYAL